MQRDCSLHFVFVGGVTDMEEVCHKERMVFSPYQLSECLLMNTYEHKHLAMSLKPATFGIAV